MASIATETNGRRRILFVDPHDGRRRVVRLGAVTLKQAEAFKLRLERLINARVTGSLDADTAKWLADLPEATHAKLVAVELAESRDSVGRVALADFTNGYLAQRVDVSRGTMAVMQQAKRHLVRFAGERKEVRAFTPADADAFKAHLLGERRARATVNKWVRYARHYFKVAKRRRMIEQNPFEHLSGAVTGDPSKRRFIPAADVARVVDVAPDPQWKLLIALARWGGLRTPSESLALTWHDVDFENKRFVVRASKTAHHDGGGVRVVPMFPELAEHFQRVFDEAEAGAVHVITRYRDPAANLRTQLVRYIQAAGLKPWGKPWQNLRVSRATELADDYPSHVCAAWLGHSEKVADAFYRQVTDEHFARAAQNPAQQPAEMACNVLQPERMPTPGSECLQGVAIVCNTLQNPKMGEVGFEPT